MSRSAAVAACLALLLATAGANRAVTRTAQQNKVGNLRDSPAARTLATLDANHDGKVDPSEVSSFAMAQGLDAAAATKEFAGLDSNGDGVLDQAELGLALVDSPAPAAEPAKPVEPVAAKPVELAAKPVAAPVAPAAIMPAAKPVELAAKPKPVAAAPAMKLAAIPSAVFHKESSPVDELPVVALSVKASGADNGKLRVSAKDAAAHVSKELEIEAQLEEDAQALDKRAAALRVSATALTSKVLKDAAEAGVKASKTAASKTMNRLEELEQNAERADVEAAALRAKSKAELSQANDFTMAAELVKKDGEAPIVASGSI